MMINIILNVMMLITYSTLTYLLLIITHRTYCAHYLVQNKNQILDKELEHIHQYYLHNTKNDLPTVTIQLPIYNEDINVIQDLIQSIVCLDYPCHKLEIQVLDDSEQENKAQIEAHVKQYQTNGIQITYLSRNNRSHYKAGALKFGMAHTDAEYFVIFDADFRPDHDFLLKTIPFFKNPKIGFIQTSFNYHNRHHSYLTKSHSEHMDTDMMLVNIARNQKGDFSQIFGTACLLRKQAILDAGEWDGEILAEDLNLSYRMQLHNWRGLNLLLRVSTSELPETIPILKQQQYRWYKGAIQVGLKLTPMILKSALSKRLKLNLIFNLFSPIIYLMLPLILLFWGLFPLLLENSSIQSSGYLSLYFITFGICFIMGLMEHFTAVALAKILNKQDEVLSKNWLAYILVPLFNLNISMIINHIFAVSTALLGIHSDFMITPKYHTKNRKSFTLNTDKARISIKTSHQNQTIKKTECFFVSFLLVLIGIEITKGNWLAVLFTIPYLVSGCIALTGFFINKPLKFRENSSN